MSKPVNIVIDRGIPYLRGRFESFADVSYLSAREISRDKLIRSNALIVRTRTQVTKSLLEGTQVRIVASATIGTDHIDTGWCRENGIMVINAPGSNAASVAQYVAAALACYALKGDFIPSETTIGVVGVGNVGSLVARIAETLGYRVLLNDPPREEAEGSGDFVSREELLVSSDIVSLHIPLTHTGRHATRHIAGPSFLKRMKKGAVLINTSRGGVVDEPSLISSILEGHLQSPVIDVWEREPLIDKNLLRLAMIATPHIAGYSAEGKLNASNAVAKGIRKHFSISDDSSDTISLPESERSNLIKLNDSLQGYMSAAETILYTCPVDKYTAELKTSPNSFEDQRNNYHVRREFSYYRVSGKDTNTINMLSQLGFRTVP